MCTSIEFRSGDFYFGRNMDIDFDFGQKVIITPRNYVLKYKSMEETKNHYALLGMGTVIDGYPFYAEAVNEKGLCMAGLNFPLNAYYSKEKRIQLDNVSPFELIPYFLSSCKSVKEVKEKIKSVHIVDIPFSNEVPLTPLHWHIADKDEGVVLESTSSALQLFENTAGILTNNPQFSYHLENLKNYTNLSPVTPTGSENDVHPFGKGLGAFGLPGDMSSASRFVKGAFLLKYAEKGEKDEENISRAFSILQNVSVVKGSVIAENSKPHFTKYSCVINAQKGAYYYKTEESLRIKEAKFTAYNLDGNKLEQLI